MLAIWKINSFSKLNLTIAQDSSIILVLFKKHNKLNLANFTKNCQPPNLIPCQIFCLYGIRHFSIAGKIFCPDQCRLTDKRFEELIRCNQLIK